MEGFSREGLTLLTEFSDESDGEDELQLSKEDSKKYTFEFPSVPQFCNILEYKPLPTIFHEDSEIESEFSENVSIWAENSAVKSPFPANLKKRKFQEISEVIDEEAANLSIHQPKKFKPSPPKEITTHKESFNPNQILVKNDDIVQIPSHKVIPLKNKKELKEGTTKKKNFIKKNIKAIKQLSFSKVPSKKNIPFPPPSKAKRMIKSFSQIQLEDNSKNVNNMEESKEAPTMNRNNKLIFGNKYCQPRHSQVRRWEKTSGKFWHKLTLNQKKQILRDDFNV